MKITATKAINPRAIKTVRFFISLAIGTAKNIAATIAQKIIVVPKSGCKNISNAIPKQINIGNKLVA